MSENIKKEKIPEAEILLNEQLKIAKKTRSADVICVVLFCVLILSATLAFWIIPDKDYSDEEKRQLQQIPTLTLERMKSDLQRDVSEMFMTYEEKIEANNRSPVLSDEIASYYSDQFPLRNTLRTLKAASEVLLLKQENNDVIFADDGYLIKKDTVTGQNNDGTDRTSADAIATINKNINIIKALKNYLSDTDTKLITAVPGRTVDVLREKLPSYYPYDDKVEPYWTAYTQAVQKAEIDTVDLRAILSEHDDEYVYYKTDHHWTGDGVYYAYVEIMKSLGQTPLDKSHFNIETVSEDFYGTVYAKSGAHFDGGDSIQLYRYAGDENFTTEIVLGDKTQEYKGFYNFKFLDTADKYSIFIGHDEFGGNNPLTYVTKDTDEPREKLVLIKDSFAHSLVPLLAYHYDLVIIDMRYYQPDGNENPYINDLAHQDDTAAVVIMENMETFMNDTELQKILSK